MGIKFSKSKQKTSQSKKGNKWDYDKSSREIILFNNIMSGNIPAISSMTLKDLEMCVFGVALARWHIMSAFVLPPEKFIPAAQILSKIIPKNLKTSKGECFIRLIVSHQNTIYVNNYDTVIVNQRCMCFKNIDIEAILNQLLNITETSNHVHIEYVGKTSTDKLNYMKKVRENLSFIKSMFDNLPPAYNSGEMNNSNFIGNTQGYSNLHVPTYNYANNPQPSAPPAIIK